MVPRVPEAAVEQGLVRAELGVLRQEPPNVVGEAVTDGLYKLL